MFTVAEWTDQVLFSLVYHVYRRKMDSTSSVGFGLSCLQSQNGPIKFFLVWSIMFTVADWTDQVLLGLVYHVYRRRMD